MRNSKKPWSRYSLTNLIEMLAQGEGGTARAEQRGPPRGKGVFLVVRILSRAIKHILLAWTGADSCCTVHASQGAALHGASNSVCCLRGLQQDQLARHSAKRVQAVPRPFLDGSVKAVTSRIHVFPLICSATQTDSVTQSRPTNGSAGVTPGVV